MTDDVLVNEREAYAFVQAIPEPIVRDLTSIALAQLRKTVTPSRTVDDATWQSRKPVLPFDARFFVEVVAAVFDNQRLITDVLNGQNPSTASGWDV